MLSLDLFFLYSEMIVRNLERYVGNKVGGHNVNNLRYADDTELIAKKKKKKKDLQQLLDIVEENNE